MREVTLSDHAADQIQAAERQRKDAFQAQLGQYEAALAARGARTQGLKHRASTALSNGRLLSWLSTLVLLVFHWLSGSPKKPYHAAAGKEEEVWIAGAQGERRVSAALHAQLQDDWILLSGYKNGGGEIDRLLVGPPGVLAIEIKYLNGVFHCEGDRWWRDKYDRYGNLVEEKLPIQDRRGRGPSVQVNAASDRLQTFLKQRAGITRVARAVVFAHDSSRYGTINGLTVDMVATVSDLTNDALARCFAGNASIEPDRIAALIQKDHRYHERPQSQVPASAPDATRRVASRR